MTQDHNPNLAGQPLPPGMPRQDDLTAGWTGAGAAPRMPWPADDWNPPFCGDIDMRIAADGTWFYNQTPILRPAMVQLFARLLRREGDDYFLVTPVEKVGIKVEDVPFIAVEMRIGRDPGTQEQSLSFRTNVEDWVTADLAHPMRFETAGEPGFKPYLCVRKNLFARLTRALSQDLAELGEIAEQEGAGWFGVKSSGCFFGIGPAATIFEDLA